MNLSITDRAKDYLMNMAIAKGSHYISLQVKGGGCSGFQYDWGYTDKTTGGNLIGDILVVDLMSEMFLFGCTVDYVQELGGSYLKVVNPNATASCGCGESFAV